MNVAVLMKVIDELGDVFHLWQMCRRQALCTNLMVSQEKLKFGINFTPLEVSLKDTVESLRRGTLSVSDMWYLLASHANKS
ncbi:hypothetical protein CK203_099581 [Vitis vinifera]|uniref:Uncharacterized protein n=1 Tax=Vitis vinifera TaxID=29760 RepID=A0A438CHJ0_VITVI|nr:hypothetical protein CK203_099581 [Vitis vinifera]